MPIIFIIGKIIFYVGLLLPIIPNPGINQFAGGLLGYGVIIMLIGDYKIGLFYLFLLLFWNLLMRIFRFSTYHKYFKKSLFILLPFSLLSGLLLQYYFKNYFFDYLFLTILYLSIGMIVENDEIKVLKKFTTVMEATRDDEKIMKDSTKKTYKLRLISSIIFLFFSILGFYL